ncbi:glycosyltransferase family 4 protein [Phenylobacterium sp. LH3H17]|uniref:glycosyltransferase family 4 protein n=1 Tax=Phenylobacterium sp. LH3H17 TaxID=2903901 RepID=UPI0020C9CF6E|nr:glycosyltransferase family 4 protein [Phenylobacterium sp. LH3H17]UTP39135.1 glycosyltransferase family 4 protein [Phenylobacterium sp. LH3H17]
MTNAALYFHPDGYDTTGQRLMGRHSAGESFLRGFIRNAEIDRLVLFNGTPKPVAELDALVRRIEPPRTPLDWIDRRQLGALRDPGCLYVPSPNIGPEAWARQPFDSRRYSLCGITHTTATHRVMDILHDLIVGPLEPWDALICTSSAVRTSVETEFEAVHEHLARRLGATRRPQPQLATIPLGVNADDFKPSPEHRKAWRERLDIPQDAVVAFYLGRLNPIAKMNPATMALTLEAAARDTGQPIYWVVAGWAGSDEETEQFHNQTRAFCPSIHYRAVDGRPADTRFSIWSVADLFISFSDNIQETFGLTPAEAMAAGLPCVVSDWDGYRETVRHGVDGFRIATHAPRPGLGQDLAFSYARSWVSYDQYLAAAAQMTAVDLPSARTAVAALVADPELRRRMGAAARERARSTFDWSAIIPQYQALWGELAARRTAALTDPARRFVNHPNPRRLDPFTLFASYPTAPMTPESVVALAPGMTWEGAVARLTAPLASYARWAMPSSAEIKQTFDQVAEAGPLRVAELTASFPAPRQGVIERSLLRLVKFGILELGPTPPVADIS